MKTIKLASVVMALAFSTAVLAADDCCAGKACCQKQVAASDCCAKPTTGEVK